VVVVVVVVVVLVDVVEVVVDVVVVLVVVEVVVLVVASGATATDVVPQAVKTANNASAAKRGAGIAPRCQPAATWWWQPRELSASAAQAGAATRY
jgi:hypothetical protein